ncbi:hypothetical protein [Kribbella solani]|uniref:hypothetical protein n=1 Tax=Kribbella solani TaxID=236067 RepID=UPI0029BD75CA|nr:hypothetical protein [Kribbella solani]MDX2971849.1 hypothetical protein [Kribbella solani]
MTDDLKSRFEQLVADPPPPSAVPSEAVFNRVRTVRRRRATGVALVAAAGAAAVALALGNVTDIGGAPPVTNSPGAPKSVITGPPTVTPKPPPPIEVQLLPTVKGRTVTMNVKVSGKAFIPTVQPENTLLPATTPFLDLSGGTDFSFGEGMPGGSDGGALDCTTKQLKQGSDTYLADTHTYKKPGSYKFTYRVMYCGTKGWFYTNASTTLTVR